MLEGRRENVSSDVTILVIMAEQKDFYRRHLPHWQPSDATFHVGFRLDGSLPRRVMEELRQKQEEMEKEIEKTMNPEERKCLMKDIHWKTFEKYETLLDGTSAGPHWLNKPKVAAIIKEALHYRDVVQYNLLVYSIMPNHVHLVFDTVGRFAESTSLQGRRDGVSSYVTDLLRELKKHTALECNRALGRSGAFWQHESYDHVIRTADELERTIQYVLNNPVKAGLVASWEEWPWSYIKTGLSNHGG